MGRIKDHPEGISQRLRNQWSFQASPEVTTHGDRSQGQWEGDGGETPGDWAWHILHLLPQHREGKGPRHTLLSQIQLKTWCFEYRQGALHKSRS